MNGPSGYLLNALSQLVQDGDQNAVVANGTTVAKWLQYSSPQETKVGIISIESDSADSDSFDVGPLGKQLSAILVEWVILRGVIPARMSENFQGITVDKSNCSAVRVFVEEYMGDRVCAEARAEGDCHPFLRLLLLLLDTETSFRLAIVYRRDLG